jgi:hypothetical protein
VRVRARIHLADHFSPRPHVDPCRRVPWRGRAASLKSSVAFDRVVRNATPMAVRCAPLEDRHGREVLTIVAKMAYGVDPATGSVRPMATAVRFDDVWSGPPGRSSLLYPSDLTDEKPGTDVLLIGTAEARPAATQLDVTLRVGSRVERTLRVHGERVWYEGPLGLAPGRARPLAPTPLLWELAWGGPSCRENPVGCGAEPVAGTPAPRIEDPAAPIGSRHPRPACFGPIAPDWLPRAAFYGTADEVWRRQRAPVRPIDFDARHNCAAPRGQWSEIPLAGDEPIEVAGMRPGQSWRFRLPRLSPRFEAIVGGRRVRPPTHLDTLLVDADAHAVELSWRASVPIPRRRGDLELVLVTCDGVLPAVAR